jgi:hypothetical protein
MSWRFNCVPAHTPTGAFCVLNMAEVVVAGNFVVNGKQADMKILTLDRCADCKPVPTMAQRPVFR